MNKTCYKKGCQKNPAFSCDCKSGIYFCKKHMGDHLLIQKNHNISPLLVRLDDSDEILIKEKCAQVLKIYPKILEKAQIFSKNLIESVLENSKKFQHEIEQITLTAKRITGCIIRDTPIDSEDLSFFWKIEVKEISSVQFNSLTLKNLIEQKFESQLRGVMIERFSDEYIFYSNNNRDDSQNFSSVCGLFGRNPSSRSFNRFLNMQDFAVIDGDIILSCIDTKTFKYQTKRFNSDIGQFCIGSTIQLQKNIYFAISTSDNSFNTQLNNMNSRNNPLYFQNIDFDKNTIKTIYKHNIPISGGGGIVLYNGSIFIFSCDQNTFKFDITNKALTNLTSLPEYLTFTSASVVQNDIYVTGYCSPYIYKFNHSTNQFTDTILFNNGTFRYLFENWLISMGDSFYELKNDSLINYGIFNDSSQGLAIYSGFRRGNFIFFITQANRLYRLDTIEKSIRLVNFN